MRTSLRIGAVLCVAIVGSVAVANGLRREYFEISAPLLPRHNGPFEEIEGPRYPADQAAKEAAVREGVLTFEALLAACEPHDETITLPAEGVTLTVEQLSANFNAVAKCALERYGSKPYWIPQLLDDVDVCALSLGDGWRLLAEGDFAEFDEADYQFLHDTLNSIAAGDESWWGNNHYGTDVYVRGADGVLKRGSIQPGVATRVTGIAEDWVGQGGVGANRTQHYEGNLGVRCIRRTVVNL